MQSVALLADQKQQKAIRLKTPINHMSPNNARVSLFKGLVRDVDKQKCLGRVHQSKASNGFLMSRTSHLRAHPVRSIPRDPKVIILKFRPTLRRVRRAEDGVRYVHRNPNNFSSLILHEPVSHSRELSGKNFQYRKIEFFYSNK